MAGDTTPYRIMLADSHAILRQGLRGILQEKPGLEVIGEASDGIELLNFLRVSELQPHMLIVDFSMPNLSGIEAARQIKMIRPGIKILALSMHKEREYLERYFSAGAEGYLLKEDSDTELFSAIDVIRQGGLYISSLLSGKSTPER